MATWTSGEPVSVEWVRLPLMTAAFFVAEIDIASVLPSFVGSSRAV
jgi:hypothetical protein